MNATDLTILFGNILENACENVRPSASHNTGGIFQSTDAFQLIRSEKNDGLISAEKYNGKAEIKYDMSRNAFTTRVMPDLSSQDNEKA